MTPAPLRTASFVLVGLVWNALLCAAPSVLFRFWAIRKQVLFEKPIPLYWTAPAWAGAFAFPVFQGLSLNNLKRPTMLMNMNAAQVIQEIDSMTEQDQGEVIAHLRQLEEDRYHQEQVKIAAQRLQDLEDGLEEEVPYEEAMELLRSRL